MRGKGRRDRFVHLFTALFLGGSISSLPIFLAIRYPGAVLTRNVIAVAQMLWSSVLIHLTGGRSRHTFTSLITRLLSFYRDWKILIPATLVTAGDHIIRQFFWPESAFGVVKPRHLSLSNMRSGCSSKTSSLSCPVCKEDERNRMVAAIDARRSGQCPRSRRRSSSRQEPVPRQHEPKVFPLTKNVIIMQPSAGVGCRLHGGF